MTIDMHVRFRGNERFLRLIYREKEWHAALKLPGELDLLSDEYIPSVPRGARLPAIELKDFDLRIERPNDNVLSMAVFKLLATRAITTDDGWIGIKLESVLTDFPNDARYRQKDCPPRQRAQILDFCAGGDGRASKQNEDRSKER